MTVGVKTSPHAKDAKADESGTAGGACGLTLIGSTECVQGLRRQQTADESRGRGAT